MTLLFATNRQDLFTLNFDFDSERWAKVAALNDSSADPDITWEVRRLHRIIKGAAAGIPNQGMLCSLIVILGPELVQIADVLKLAGAVWGLPRKRPIAGRGSR